MTVFDVFLDGKKAGIAQFQVEGLYLKIQSSCSQIPQKLYRLWMIAGKKRVDLGIGIYNGNSFLWNKKIPLKEIESVELRFELNVNEQIQNKTFHPVSSDLAFPLFSAVQNSYFGTKNGIKGLWFKADCPQVQD